MSTPKETPFIAASLLGAALLALGIGFMAPAGEQAKLAYNGDLWCVSNFIEERPYRRLPDGRAAKDPLLVGKEDWIVREQAAAQSKEEAENIVIANSHGAFVRSNAEELRTKLSSSDKDFFSSHFNEGATVPGPCLGTGDKSAQTGRWLNDVVREKCFGITNFGSCKAKQTAIETKNVGLVNLPGKGKIVQESHIVTQEENFQPTSVRDQIDRHYQVTGQAIGKQYSHNDTWTPAEGGGSIGRGSSVSPPANAEPWIMNMYWTGSSVPAPGTRFLVKNPVNSKTVAAAGGYETGPSTGYTFGAQEEVLQALGVVTGNEVEVGLAEDQTLSFGPIECSENKSETEVKQTEGAPEWCPQIPPIAGPAAGKDYRFAVAEKFIEQLSYRGKSIGDVGSPLDYNGDPIITGRGECALPIPESANYGSAYNSRRGNGKHRGIDFSAATGTKVVATMGGTVRLVEDFGFRDGSGSPGNSSQNGGYGNRIKIEHDNGVWSEYHHLRSGRMYVKMGDRVEKGQVIAEVDDNGWSSGPHLHFQLMRNSSTESGWFNAFPCLGI